MTKVIRILNIVYMAIATVAIIFFFAVPFVDASVNVTLNNQYVFELIQKNVPGAEKLKINDVFVDDQKVSATVRLNITPIQLVQSYSDKSKENIQTYFITPNCNDLVDALLPQIKNVAMAILRYTAKDTVNNEIEKYNQTAAETINVDEETLNEATDNILEELEREGATTESVANTIYEEIIIIIGEDGSSNIDKELIEQTLAEQLEKYGLVNEDGTIRNDDGTINQILYDLIKSGTIFPPTVEGGGENPSTSSVPPNSEPNLLIRKANETTNNNQKKTEEDVKNALAESLTELLGPQFVIVTTTAYQTLFVVLIVFVVVWGFLLVYTFIRTFRRKKCYTFVGPLFWFVGFFQIALGIGLMVASQFPIDFTSMISQLDIFETIKPNISASALVPGILVIVCIPLTIVYKHFKKKLKKQIRIDSAVEKKIAEIKGNQ